MKKPCCRIVILSLCLVQGWGTARGFESYNTGNPMDIEGSSFRQSLSASIKPNINNEREEFHIFGVGQGNSQLAVYERSKFAVLYDCGSNSKQTHPKINKLLSSGCKDFYFKRRRHKQSSQYDHDFADNFLDKLGPLENRFSTALDKGTPSSHSYSNNSNETYDDLEGNIKNVIKSYNILNLFIFLSHPDADHINLINEKTIPGTVNVYAFLGGHWFGQENLKKDNVTQDSQKILNFLLYERNQGNNSLGKTIVEFPYYWGLGMKVGYSNGLRMQRGTYHDMMNSLKQEKDGKAIKNFYQTFKENFYFNEPKFFRGNLFDLLERRNMFGELTQDYPRRIAVALDRPLLTGSSAIYSTLVLTNLKEDLKKVFILSMNDRLGDVNAESILMRFTMLKLGINFFCTGDAHNASFEQAYLKNTFFKWTDGDYLNFVVLPHHGSAENLSPFMLQLTYPDFFIISSGNGKKYGHPDLETIQYYTKAQNSNFFNKSRFFEHFESGYQMGDNKAIFFKDKKTALEKGRIITLRNIPIMCTNIHSTISVEEGGIKSNFNDKIVIEEQDICLQVDISRHVSPIAIGWTKKIKDWLLYNEQEKVFYYKLYSKDASEKYYKVTWINFQSPLQKPIFFQNTR